nr:MAG TPA: TFIIB zinc-binding [Caudoviricetes sp.]
MTENKAIEELHRIRPYGGIIPQRRAEALDVAIKALEEVQQYRQIGTVEECREAVEKQTARKGIREKIKKGYNRGMHHCYCPVCYEKGDLRNKYNVGLYCSDCGQKLDWSDEE